MKNIFFTLLFFSSVFNTVQAQCDSEVCNSNTGLYSNDDATNIAYDNIGSGYHSSYIREPNSGWRIWGEDVANNGVNDLLNPTSFNVANYPALTGTIYKMGMGSQGINAVQLIVLTATGLFALGEEGMILDAAITTSTTFQKITVNGKLDGLPLGIAPVNVKMMFTSARTIIITTCAGEVYVLSRNINVRGNGGGGDSLQWYKVMESATQPLTNVIVARGNSVAGYALKSDGTLWTWGDDTYLGNGTAALDRTYATQMILPAGLPGVKTIQSTQNGALSSYYILGTDKKVYSIGGNNFGQLGDRSSTLRTVWVNAKNPDNSIITDAAWISANEHDPFYAALSVIKTGGVLYTAGINSYYMVGRTVNSGVNYLALPNGVAITDVITYAEAGGHTCALIKQGSPRYGYVGHRINGSMGNGLSGDITLQSYDFITPPIVAVCGTFCVPPTVTANSPICPGQNAVFTISGTPGDIVTYTINNGSNQTVIIGIGGSATVTINGATSNQTINLSFILGGTGACSNNLSLSTTITIGEGSGVVPIFNQTSSICFGDPLDPLPTTSINGIVGTWSPVLNNNATTTYTFTPTSSCAVTTTMTIYVIPAGTIPTFTQITPICQGGIITLPLASLEGISGSWSPPVNNSTTTTYTFTPAITNTCISITVQMTVVITNGTTPTFAPIVPICTGNTLNPLPTTSLEGIIGTWSPALNNTATTTYTFAPAAGSCANTSQLTIIVNQILTPLFNQVAPICENDILAALPLVSNNNITGTWSPALNTNSTTTYTFTATSVTCATPVQMTIVVNPKVTPTFPTFNPLCYGDTVFNLPLVSNNNVNGTWMPDIINTATTTYTFTPNNGECANSAQLQVQVFNDYDFTYDGYCENTNFILEVVSNPTFDVNSSSFNWQYNTTTVSTNPFFNVTAYLSSTLIVESLPHTFTITITDANGCDKMKTIVLDNVYCGIQKGISINNDGLNEFFDLRLLDVEKLSIFNRYGIKVYSKDNYYDEWHGQTDSGDILPDGTYYYLIDFVNEASKSGWIYVVKEN